jgi:hypothetical protein
MWIPKGIDEPKATLEALIEKKYVQGDDNNSNS